jgi:hypothetical protein
MPQFESQLQSRESWRLPAALTVNSANVTGKIRLEGGLPGTLLLSFPGCPQLKSTDFKIDPLGAFLGKAPPPARGAPAKP